MISYENDYMYADERLSDTYVLKDDEFVYVERVNPLGEVTYRRWNALDEQFHCRLEDLNLSPPILGYVNFPYAAKYLVRYPKRQFKQGLNIGLLKISPLETREIGFFLTQCSQNDYPDLESVVEVLYNKECVKKAFSKRYSLATKPHGTESFELWYKDKSKVGQVKVKNLELKLEPEFEFLTEDLMESCDENYKRFV